MKEALEFTSTECFLLWLTRQLAKTIIFTGFGALCDLGSLLPFFESFLFPFNTTHLEKRAIWEIVHN